MRLKLFKAERRYSKDILILEMVWANNSSDVMRILDWELDDKPTLQVTEIPEKRGCFLSVSAK